MSPEYTTYTGRIGRAGMDWSDWSDWGDWGVSRRAKALLELGRRQEAADALQQLDPSNEEQQTDRQR